MCHKQSKANQQVWSQQGEQGHSNSKVNRKQKLGLGCGRDLETETEAGKHLKGKKNLNVFSA